MGGIIFSSYNSVGQIISSTDANGAVASYTDNGLDLVTNINYNNGKQVGLTPGLIGGCITIGLK